LQAERLEMGKDVEIGMQEKNTEIAKRK